MSAYLPQEFGGRPDLRNTWRATNVPLKHQRGERAAATDGKDLYFVGNNKEITYSRNIDRYTADTDTWQTLTQLPEDVNAGAMSTIYNKKMYIIGQYVNSLGYYTDPFLYVYDLEQITVHNIPLLDNMRKIKMYYFNKHLVAFENYLLCANENGNIYVFDIAANEWLENPVELKDVFDDYEYSNYMSPAADKLYAAGTLGGNFILYELKLTITKE